MAAVAMLIMAAGASAHVHHRGHQAVSGFTASVFASGAAISQPVAGGSEPVSKPDDITHLGDHIFVGFHGVGAQGEPSASGNTTGTTVEFDRSGHELARWDVRGKVDGLTADPQTWQLIATVNEEANSSAT